ncbi:pyridoxal-phosphate dependent enzyme [Longispora sp. NPDC051575]|uniref:pyridoxal-phosphate dependent enzyme n=1 Tax=Longispora sp. NPDC051575 TaxID=3154943 RepID=UPI0034443101
MSVSITADHVHAAARRLHGVAHRTPVATSRTLDGRVGAEVFVKCENLQRTGSFKFRGAYNAIARLGPGALRHGVVAFSSGNHAQAVALAAAMVGTRAVLVMPTDTPELKLLAAQDHGAEVVTFDRYTEDRFAITARLAAERHLTVIPPYDHPDVIAGAGSTAVELLDQVGELDALVLPLGGGGQLAGCATLVKALAPGIRVIGVESLAGNKNRRSLDAGTPVRIHVPRTIADGVTGEVTGELTFPIIRALADDVTSVDDVEILVAMGFLFDRMKLVAEPTGALGVAALLAGKVPLAGRRIGVVISGGNVGVDRFCELLGRPRAARVPL